MSVNYFTGYGNGYDYSGRHGSPGNTMNDPSYSNAFENEEPVSPSTLSPGLHHRHDSIVSPSISSLSHFSAEQHQAELQPRALAAPMTPHVNSLHPHRSYAMSRGPSQISNHSSASSGQQYGDYQPYTAQGFSHHGFGIDGIPMSRSISDTSAFQTHPTNYYHSGSLPCNLSARSFASSSANKNPADILAAPQYGFQNVHVENSAEHVDWSSLAGLGAVGNSIGDFGQSGIE
jgi:hypothetical protein